MNIFHKAENVTVKPEEVNADQVMDRVKAHVRKFRIDVKDIFRDFDRLRSGKITKPKFLTGLELCKLNLDHAELVALEKRFQDPNAKDKVMIAEFVDDIERVFVTKNMHLDPGMEAKTYKVKGKSFELGILSEEEMHDFQVLMDSLAMVTQKNRVKMRRFFKEHDKGIKNRVKQSEFRSIMSILNISLSDKQLKLITQRFGISHFGTKLDINYDAFCNEVEALEVRRTSQFASLMERMRKQFRKRGARGIIGLQSVFKRMDSYDGNRILDKHEFIEGLTMFGFDVTKSEAKQLLKAYDRNNDGYVSFDEFIRGMRGSLNSRRLKMVVKAFKKIDEDRQGVITIDQMRRRFNAHHHPKVISGEMKEDDALEIFVNSFENSATKDEKVFLDSFEDYYANISSSIDDDEYFVRMMEKVWNFEEYEYET
mmetsp:Transcript_17218/g.30890  ORF Transcript_17218/g.30890 Transcript_17218/m.30890 type:complete len:425 (+) Transcript_17218:254-1528(+)|eukprot:CAMPEP_0197527498 /NCGR_PEP_ID=MMETSP1318-20131121/21885_1 /TAXON_ID=552666 /ORGANISM="Partenskyella glossopodia, Strain RCC365" /LENGTH=424 /DNA_ID=CAMNT_0043082187 /DNA_START=173 /DNA_END=1447 /DNA_ORIENTATION=-